MAKKFTYKGKTIEELVKLDLKEFVKLIPSRKRRSLLRGISDQQNAVFISWSQNKNDVSGGGSEFDTTFIET